MSSHLSVVSLLCLWLLTLVCGQATCPNSTSGQLVCPSLSSFKLISLFSETVSGYPALIEVTLEELETGLESGSFTSVDLVNVCTVSGIFTLQYSRDIGVHCEDQGGQWHSQLRYRDQPRRSQYCCRIRRRTSQWHRPGPSAWSTYPYQEQHSDR